MDQLKEFINEMGCKIHDNLCYPVNIRNEFATEISVNLDTLLEKIQCIILSGRNIQIRIYITPVLKEIICNSQLYFKIYLPLSGIASTKLCDIVFCFLSKRGKNHYLLLKQLEVLKDGIQYFAGYVIQKVIKNAKKLKSTPYGLLDVLEHMVTDTSMQKLIQIQSRGGLTAAILEANQIFFKPEEIFRAHTKYWFATDQN